MPQANHRLWLLVLAATWLAGCSLPTQPQDQTPAPLPRNVPMPGSDIEIGQSDDSAPDSAGGVGGGGSSSGPLPGSGPPNSPGQGGSAEQIPEESAAPPAPTESDEGSETVSEGAPGAASGEGSASDDTPAVPGEGGAEDGVASPESDGGGRTGTQSGGSSSQEALDHPPEDLGHLPDDDSGSDSEPAQAGYGDGEDGSGDASVAGVEGRSGPQVEQDQQDLGTSPTASGPDVSPGPDAGESGELTGWGEGGSDEGGASGDTAVAAAEGGADEGADSPESAGGGRAQTPDGGSGRSDAPERALEDPGDLMGRESGSDSEGAQPVGSGDGGDGGDGSAGGSYPGEPENSGLAGSEGQGVTGERSAQRSSEDQSVPQSHSESVGEQGGSGARAESGRMSQGSGPEGVAGSGDQSRSQTGVGDRSSSDHVESRAAGTEEGFGSGRSENDGDRLSRASRGGSGAEQHSEDLLESAEEGIDGEADAVDARTAAGRAGEALGGGAGGPNSDNGTASDVGRGGSGEREFERSLGRSDDIILSEREAIAARGGPAAADSFGQSVGGSAANPGSDVAGGGQGRGGADAIQADEDTSLAAARFEGCEHEDRVARQLCEAASKEEDPFLRAALWEEYNEYRKVLAENPGGES